MSKSITAIISVVVGFAVTFGFGFVVIPWLKKLKFGQTILDIGPKWHKSKEGIPTMGGILIFIGTAAAFLVGLLADLPLNQGAIKADLGNPFKLTTLLSGIGLAVGMGLIGFLDDYIKVVKKRNLGLTARQKTLLQFAVAAAFLVSLLLGGMSSTWIPFVGDVDITSGFGLLFWPIALFFVYGFTNSVNLTDGLDGLASSVTIVVCCAFMIASSILGFSAVNLLSASVAGALVGFLMWNSHPAKVFMGDTGSMFLGGVVVALAFGIGRPILLILSGIVYLLEALSDILQVAHYKRTKKRLFKMAPIHHHFEMLGWSEEKIVFAFSAVAVLGSVLMILLIRFG